MARVSAPRTYKPQQPKRAAAPGNPPKRDSFTGQRVTSPGMGDVQKYKAPTRAASNTMGRAQSNQIAIQQMQQRQARAMPDRNTPAGYVSPYNQQQNTQAMYAQPYMNAYGPKYTQAMYAQPYMNAYGPKYAPTMQNVNRVGAYQTPAAVTQAQRVSQASAGRYNAAYQQGRWAPDYAAARKYAGYGSPSQGLMDAPWSEASQQATADRYTAQWLMDAPWSEASQQATADRYTARAQRYFNPPSNGGGGGGGWVDWGGGGGGGGGYTERAPEWYERMAQWSYGKG